MSNSKPAVRSSPYAATARKHPGYKYRKRDPGSGGARTGAGRRPDLSPALRQILLNRCETLYGNEARTYGLRVWASDILSIWLEETYPPRANYVWYQLTRRNVRIQDHEFLLQLIYSPEQLYSDDGKLNFDVAFRQNILRNFANIIEVSVPLTDELPLGTRKAVRRRIAVRVIDEAKIEPPLSVDFVLNAWRTFRATARD
ncbi:hypothetical protein [Asticcacaulis sp. EMRT-3]|uniref:hypothetical protein n=1 Tax=Asticcacaulis sp. EMRT-3 TaxID=3040349 RepID=UPI0024AF19B3|nr:hypothetical protein [Asticcacaulis sp. EMRT-3]MDI7775593.1 hypothetical protein [Asticcacaulis sp. EMRT-3]